MSNTDLGSLKEEVSAKRVRQEIVISNRVLRVPKMAGKSQNLNVTPCWQLCLYRRSKIGVNAYGLGNLTAFLL